MLPFYWKFKKNKGLNLRLIKRNKYLIFHFKLQVSLEINECFQMQTSDRLHVLH